MFVRYEHLKFVWGLTWGFQRWGHRGHPSQGSPSLLFPLLKPPEKMNNTHEQNQTPLDWIGVFLQWQHQWYTYCTEANVERGSYQRNMTNTTGVRYKTRSGTRLVRDGVLTVGSFLLVWTRAFRIFSRGCRSCCLSSEVSVKGRQLFQ